MAVKKPVKKATKGIKTPRLPHLSWSLTKLNAWWDVNCSKGVLQSLSWGVAASVGDGFPGCCAFDVVHGFPDLQHYDDSATDNEYRARLVYQLKSRDGGNKLYLATTIPEQRAHKILPLIGFRRLGAWVNPNTGTQVTLWQARG